ncbi:capsular biosynthesis protein [Salinisphaera sp. T31B1]|uniref:capsular biosynthesis protein n=1 Tax=Salinisphaera sp. T31B1 TaxID=727963 RepID=UPI00333FF297
MNRRSDRVPLPLIPTARLPATLGQIWRALRARWRVVAAVTGCFVVLATVAILLLPDTYTARVALIIDFPGDDPVTGQLYPSNLAESYKATQVDLLTSYKVRLATVKALGLDQDSDAKARFAEQAGSGATLDEWLAQQIGRHTSVEAGATSQLLALGYTDKNAERSATIANALVRQYIDAATDMALEPAQARQARYSAFLDQLSQRVDKAQDQLTRMRQSLDVIAGGANNEIDTQRLEDLGLKLNQAEAEQQAARAKVDQVQALKSQAQPLTAQADILSSAYVQELKGRLLAMQSDYAQQRHALGPNHPRIQSLEAEMATVRSRLRDEIDAYVESNRSQAEMATKREAALRSTFERERAAVIDQQDKRDRVAKYERDLAGARQVYEGALREYDQVLGGSEMQRQNISVVSWANPPRHPTGLGAKAKLIVALLFGLMAGTLAALLMELFDRRVRGDEDVTRELDLPLLGILPPSASGVSRRHAES